jgi:hypothetical protein
MEKLRGVEFTKEQATHLEDRVINKISPAYMALGSILAGEMPCEIALRGAQDALMQLTEHIRGLRPRDAWVGQALPVRDNAQE